jgi:hypothetical protein
MLLLLSLYLLSTSLFQCFIRWFGHFSLLIVGCTNLGQSELLREQVIADSAFRRRPPGPQVLFQALNGFRCSEHKGILDSA